MPAGPRTLPTSLLQSCKAPHTGAPAASASCAVLSAVVAPINTATHPLLILAAGCCCLRRVCCWPAPPSRTPAPRSPASLWSMPATLMSVRLAAWQAVPRHHMVCSALLVHTEHPPVQAIHAPTMQASTPPPTQSPDGTTTCWGATSTITCPTRHAWRSASLRETAPRASSGSPTSVAGPPCMPRKEGLPCLAVQLERRPFGYGWSRAEA